MLVMKIIEKGREGEREKRENRERIIRPILSFVELLFFFNVGP